MTIILHLRITFVLPVLSKKEFWHHWYGFIIYWGHLRGKDPVEQWRWIMMKSLYVNFCFIGIYLYMYTVYGYCGYLLWVLKLSTWVLKYSSTKPKLSLYGKNLGSTQGACTLYKHRPMQPEPKSQNIGVLSLNLLNWYVDTIFVLPSLGTDQGMST